MGNLQVKEPGPRIKSDLPSVVCREFKLKTFNDLTRTSARHRQGRPGLAELAARQEPVGVGGGWGWGCGCRLGLPPRRLRGFAVR